MENGGVVSNAHRILASMRDCGYVLRTDSHEIAPDRDDLRAILNPTAELIPDMAVKTVLKSPIGEEAEQSLVFMEP